MMGSITRHGLAFFVGMMLVASPADALPQFFTFEGPITFAQTCFSGEFAPPCETSEGGTVSYTFLVDPGRPGERIISDASGETVTTLDGTFFARLPGDEPSFGVVGPEEGRVRTTERIGAGLTLHDLKDVSTDVPGCCLFQTRSVVDVIGLPLASFSVGAHFEGHQFDLIHAIGAISGVTIQVDSALTLTEIHGIPEPGTLLLLGASVVGLAWASFFWRP